MCMGSLTVIIMRLAAFCHLILSWSDQVKVSVNIHIPTEFLFCRTHMQHIIYAASLIPKSIMKLSSLPPTISVHYSDVIMDAMASQITSLMIVYSTVYSGADRRKRQSSASLAFVQGIHRWPVNSQHKEPVMRKMFPFDDIIMWQLHVLVFFFRST